MKTHQLAAKFSNASGKKPGPKKPSGKKPGLQRRQAAENASASTQHLPFAYSLSAIPVQRAEAPQGGGSDLSGGLRHGVEALSGVSMAGVKVHRNSAFPAQMQAHATAQGNHIHLAPGQDRHLPHEAWHIAQQRQGRVAPTAQMAGVALNTDRSLESEADRMGARAASLSTAEAAPAAAQRMAVPGTGSVPMQLLTGSPVLASSPTVIKNGTTTLASVTESNGVEAVVDPSDWGTGSGTTDGVRTISRTMQQNFGGYWVAGHMLNNWLGGPGNNQANITAFTKHDNSEHLHDLEKYAKEAVHNGNSISYKTKVTERANFSNGSITVKNIATKLAGGYKTVAYGSSYSAPPQQMTLDIGPGSLGYTKSGAKSQ